MEDDFKLADLVRDRPILYSPGDPLYNDTNARNNTWMEVARAMNQPLAEIENRWKKIQDKYKWQNERKKVEKDFVLRSKKMKKLMERLEFLDQIESETENLKTNAPLETIEQFDVAEIEIKSEEQINDNLETFPKNSESNTNENPDEQRKEKISQPSKNKRDDTHKGKMRIVMRVFGDPGKDMPSTEIHAIDVLFRSMAMSVKRLSPENQANAKTRICQIVSKFELREKGVLTKVPESYGYEESP